MRYVMKQHLISFGDDFTIRNDQDKDVYFVDGKVFTLRDKLLFKDMQGVELARIEKQMLSWGKTYNIYRNGDLAATVKKKKFTFLKAKFSIDVPGPNDLDAEGDFLDHEYGFYRGGRQVATVSKKFFSWTDTYGIDVAPGEDDILILASAVVIDLCCHNDKD